MEWVVPFGSVDDMALSLHNMDMFSDASIVVAGHKSGEVFFGYEDVRVPQSIAGETFLARFDADGSVAWVDHAGPETGVGTRIEGLAALSDGAVFFIGSHSGDTFVLGEGQVAETTLRAADIYGGVFYGALDQGGQLLWAKGIPGELSVNTIWMHTASVGPSGNIAVGGELIGTATIGAGEPNETVLTSEFLPFVASFSPDGNLRWATAAHRPTNTGPSGTWTRSVATLGNGSVVAAGLLNPPAIFGFGEGPGETLLATDTKYLAAFDDQGSLQFAQGSEVYMLSLTAVGLDGFVSTGWLSDGAFLTTNASAPQSAVAEPAGFLAVHDSSGYPTVVEVVDGVGSIQLVDACARDTGGFYAAGNFVGTAVFGAGRQNEHSLTSAVWAMFVASFDENGRFEYVQQLTSNSDAGVGYVRSVGNTIVLSGGFTGTTIFDPAGASETRLQARANDAYFIMRLVDESLVVVR